jgi:hypothetical protein
MGWHAGLTLLACGRSHEFDSILTKATTAFNATFDATTAAVARFFAQRGGPGHD